jgi:protein-glutamine gamma-glutamyltransferase
LFESIGAAAMSAVMRHTAKLLSPLQFQWSVAALASACLPCMLWMDWHFTALVIAILGMRTFTARRSPKAWPGALRILLVIIALWLVVRTHGGILGREPGGSLLICMMALKATESASARDARLLVSFSLFVIVASFLLTQSIVALMLSAVATVVCFCALEMLSRPAVGGPSGSPLGRLRAREVVSLLSFAIPATIALWLLFPRLSTPLWGTSESQTTRSGLSNEMRPDSIREMLIDDHPAMRIRFDNNARPAPSTLYFRGPVLWNLSEDGTWSASELLATRFDRPPAPQPTDVSYEVIMEPTDQRILFVADQAISVDEGQILFTAEQRFMRAVQISDLLRYRARSSLNASVQANRTAEVELQIATRLPANRNPRLQTLGKSLRAKHGANHRAIVQELIETYRGFSYTLLPPEPLGLHTMDEFYFDNRTGFCQHFSSSFAIIARAAGVPTRVATGFAGGEYLPAGYLLVTNARAHAWNEVYLEGAWQRFDATAQVPPERVDRRAREALGENRAEWLRSFSNTRDELADWWNRTILNFNANSQSQLFKPFGVQQTNWKGLVSVLTGVIIALAFLWAAMIYWRERKPKNWLDAAFERVQAALARKGIRRACHEGPQDFHQRVLTHNLNPASITAWQAFHALHLQIRFAHGPEQEVEARLKAEFLARTKALVQELKS